MAVVLEPNHIEATSSRRILFDTFFFLEKLFCARENDFKFPIGRSEGTRLTGHGGVCRYGGMVSMRKTGCGA